MLSVCVAQLTVDVLQDLRVGLVFRGVAAQRALRRRRIAVTEGQNHDEVPGLLAPDQVFTNFFTCIRCAQYRNYEVMTATGNTNI